ncbi:MAG: prepilin-type N-terminal cleavage/methylation domain-containing protein [Myxococcota bacterium]|nr:prepilin-type N-terminal cleavage/methylation domain-containing protein [Myxococcota bacterium]
MNGRKLQHQRAFTFVELMIALSLGSLLMLSIYEVFRSNTEQYYLQEQQLEMGRSLSLSLEFMKEELLSAGRLSARQSALPLAAEARPDPRFCGAQLSVNALELFDNEDPGARNDFPPILNQFGNAIRPDRLRLLVDASGAEPLRVLRGQRQLQVAPTLAQHTEVAQRALTEDAEDRFERLYDEQALLRISDTANDRYDLVLIQGSDFNNGLPTINLTSNPCVDCSAGGCLVNPVHWVEYAIVPDPTLATARRTLLVRRRLSLQDGSLGEPLLQESLTLAPNVIDLQLWGLYDTHRLNEIPRVPVDPQLSDDRGNWEGEEDALLLRARPQRIRGLELMLSVRSPREDPKHRVRFDPEGRLGAQERTWFALNGSDRDGYARIRSLIASVSTPNLFQEEQ